MKFLAFVTSDAECEKIIQLLEAGDIEYEREVIRDQDKKAQGYIIKVSEKNFDRADEILSMPGHDFSFNVLNKNIAKLESEKETEMRINRMRRKVVRRMALYIGVGGMVYMLYALITGR